MYYKTAAGVLKLNVANQKLISATFINELIENENSFTTDSYELNFDGTSFQISVWQAALQIPMGSTCTYKELAIAIEKPKAHRAVANALGANKIPYFIPCHRVIRNDGKLGGYTGGIEKKIALLNAEGVRIKV